MRPKTILDALFSLIANMKLLICTFQRTDIQRLRIIERYLRSLRTIREEIHRYRYIYTYSDRD